MNFDNKKVKQKREILNPIKKRNNSYKIPSNNYQTNPNKKKLDDKEKIIPKQKFNIDLFLGVKEQFQKETSSKNNNNIYLNFYNKHTKNQIFQKENKISKKFLENNKEYIKEKQEKFKLKKEQEERKRKQKEKEDTNEYRKLQMAKLYKVENLYNKEIAKRKNNNKSSTKKNISQNMKEVKKININNSNNKNSIDTNEDEKKIIKITREEYDNKLDSLIKQTRIYLNELEKLPIANKNNKTLEREIQLNKNIDDIQKQIKKYQLYEGIEIIEN